MPLTMKEASLLAQLSPEDLMTQINEGSLVAVKVADEAEENYIIEEYDLDAFLKKKSFDALWSESKNDEDDPEEELRRPSIAGNLRRVLTAEAVSELKIQHQVLTSRVQTLERLFSEFMDAEKDAENTLVLEDDWKIAGSAGQAEVLSPVQVSHGNLAALAKYNNSSDDNVGSKVDYEAEPWAADSLHESDTSKVKIEVPQEEEASLQSNKAARKAYQLQTAEDAGNAYTKALQSETSDGDDAFEPPSEEVKAKGSKGLLAMKLKLMEADKTVLDAEEAGSNIDALEEVQENQQDIYQGDDEDDNRPGIAERLKEYERRLAHAKQTATQMWH
ncbi:hypothetical protein N9E48_01165 [Paracoccaceae bacterium]|nr:hypothetical protein [Paracoccaceae bacterium]